MTKQNNTEKAQKIKVSFDFWKEKKGIIILKFPQVINKMTGLRGNNGLWGGYDLWSEYNIISRNKKNKIVFGMSINCSDLMNPVRKDYIAVTERGIILDRFEKDYRNYFDKSVKNWKDEVIEKFKNSKKEAQK